MLVRAALGLALLGLFWGLPAARRAYIRAVVTHDAPPGPAPELPSVLGHSNDVGEAELVRVVLVDGVDLASARTMPAWNQVCARGLDLVVDTGFPTVSLPVQVALWSGLTQQQTGILYRSGRQLEPPLAGIPAAVPGSIAVAESHGYIVRSLGFAQAMPEHDKVPGWRERWLVEARAAVAGPARLAFVHILAVDGAGHAQGGSSPAYRAAVTVMDGVLGDLVAARPDARWLVLSDHGHLPRGGHAGEEPSIRRVRACLAGPGVTSGRGGPIALVDLSRALAMSLGVPLAPQARGRSLGQAIESPVDDELIPALPPGQLVPALLVLFAGLLATAWGAGGRAAFAPWWWPVAILLLVLLRGAPTLSTTMIYSPRGRDMLMAFWPALALLAPWAVLVIQRRGPVRALAALLALPAAGFVAGWIASGGVPLLWGAELAPIVPRWTAWTSVFALMLSTACGVVGLAVLVTGRRSSSPGSAAAPGARATAAPPPSDPG